jgi:hypothetical protein
MKGENIVTGKRGEYIVVGKFLEKGFTVYTPVADIEGIDCIVRNDNNRLIEIQIKTRNKREGYNKQFRVKNFKPHKDFFICCYMIDTDELWTIPSFVFYKNSFLNKFGNRGLLMNIKKERELSKYKDNIGLELLKLGLKNKKWLS